MKTPDLIADLFDYEKFMISLDSRQMKTDYRAILCSDAKDFEHLYRTKKRR